MENKKQNVAGGGAREMARRREVRWLWIALIAFLGLGIIAWANWSNRKGGNWIVTYCMAGLLFISRELLPAMDFLQKREDDAIRGAAAEENVGSILNCLPQENHIVLHDVDTGRGNIDHVIVRRDGAVFIIETKSQRGKVGEQNGRLLINGRRPVKNFVGQAGSNAIWLSKTLQQLLGATPWVHAVLVFPNAYVSVRSKLGQVDVVGTRFLERWMAKASPNREIARRVALQWGTLGTI